MSPRFPRRLIVPALFLGLASLAAAQAPGEDGIVFLHLRMEAERLTLERAVVRPGRLKRFHTEAGGALVYEVVGRDGARLLEGGLDDPLARRLEYEDPAVPGRLTARVVRAGAARLVLRLPYREGMARVDFFRAHPAAGKQGRVLEPVGSVSLEGVR